MLEIWPGIKSKELSAVQRYAQKVIDLKKKWKRNPDYRPSLSEIPRLPGM